MAKTKMTDTKKARQYDNVISLHCSGKSIPEIVKRTGLSEGTVRKHIISYFRSLA